MPRADSETLATPCSTELREARPGARRSDPLERPDRPVLRRREAGTAAARRLSRRRRADRRRGGERRATAIGGMTMGADPLACAAISVAAGDGLIAFFVRKERKEHGLQRWIEGPVLEPEPAAWWSRTSSRPAGRPSARSSASWRRATRSPASPRGRPPGGRRRGDRAVTARPTGPCVTIDELYPERPDRLITQIMPRRDDARARVSETGHHARGRACRARRCPARRS